MSESGNKAFWDQLIGKLLHETQITIIEAMLWLDQPLSPSELAKVFEGRLKLSHVSYHIGHLADLKILKVVGREQVRGTVKSFYRLVRP